jgi:aspartyl-tRNA(Asn)/glutamyl-tRNA(Gln) amidotransferase subunit A
MVTAALGTQTAGSVIRPSSYCGVVGYVPSAGWISRTGVFPCSWSLDRVGIIARSVGDAAAILEIVVGFDGRDPASIRARRRATPRPVDFAGLRFGLLKPMMERASRTMRAAVGAVATQLAGWGSIVEVVEDADVFHAGDVAHRTIMSAEAASVHEELYRKHASDYSPRIRGLVEEGLAVSAADYLRAQRIRRRFREQLERLLAQFDFLLSPSAIGTAERTLSSTGAAVMNIPASLAGLPVISLPISVSLAGLPMGAQLTAKHDHDIDLLEVASEIEARVDFDRSALERSLARISRQPAR